jgi:FKBP-type peptidyl-prolyl cis-trans isomerase FklB
MKRLLSAALSLALTAGAWGTQDESGALKTDPDRMTYSLGYQIGQDFKREGVEVRPQAMRRGVADALAGAAPLMTPVQMRRTLLDLKREIKVKAAAEAHRQEAEARAKDEAFLAENAKKEGVVTLPSGLQYKVIAPGAGKFPGVEDTVTVDYKGTLIDGTELDSSYERGEPATFPLRGVIPGWTEALQRMKEGGQWELYVPSELAYGDRGRFAGRTLVFDLKLLKVEAAKPGPASQVPTAPAAGTHPQKPAATTD